MAFNPSNPIRKLGNIFSPFAPAASAAKHSVGVSTPGQLCIPAALVAAITPGSALGDTTSLPPAAATPATSSTVSTVPAPISACPPKARTMAAMLSNGSGEFSGTSIEVMPLAISASAIGTASAGVIPRRMAIRLRLMRGNPSVAVRRQ